MTYMTNYYGNLPLFDNPILKDYFWISIIFLLIFSLSITGLFNYKEDMDKRLKEMEKNRGPNQEIDLSIRLIPHGVPGRRGNWGFLHDKSHADGILLGALCWGRHYQPYTHLGVQGFIFSPRFLFDNPVVNGQKCLELQVSTVTLTTLETNNTILSEGLPVERVNITSGMTRLTVKQSQ